MGAANFSLINVISSIDSNIFLTLVILNSNTKFMYGILYYEIRNGITTSKSNINSP